MLKLHQVLLHEFAKLILNQRIEQTPSTLRHSNILNLWQIKGIWMNNNSDLRLNGILRFQLKFGSQKQSQQKSNRTTLKRQFQISHYKKFKKTQRLVLLQSRSILGILANLPLSQDIPYFNKHIKIVQNTENNSIPIQFQIINFPVIPCSSKKVHYQKEIQFSPQLKLTQKPITQREDIEMNTLHLIQQNLRQRTKASSQIIETIEYFIYTVN